jgi:hypothetical protein
MPPTSAPAAASSPNLATSPSSFSSSNQRSQAAALSRGTATVPVAARRLADRFFSPFGEGAVPTRAAIVAVKRQTRVAALPCGMSRSNISSSEPRPNTESATPNYHQQLDHGRPRNAAFRRPDKEPFHVGTHAGGRCAIFPCPSVDTHNVGFSSHRWPPILRRRRERRPGYGDGLSSCSESKSS